MIKAALEKVINEDMAEIWARLNSEERRLVVENMEVHTFKKNQLIYAEGDEPEFLWVLLKGKVKKTKEGVGGRVQILRLIRPVQYFGYRAFFCTGILRQQCFRFRAFHAWLGATHPCSRHDKQQQQSCVVFHSGTIEKPRWFRYQNSKFNAEAYQRTPC